MSVGSPEHGTLTSSGGTVTYTPPTDWIGSFTVGYTIADSHGAQATSRRRANAG